MSLLVCQWKDGIKAPHGPNDGVTVQEVVSQVKAAMCNEACCQRILLAIVAAPEKECRDMVIW